MIARHLPLLALATWAAGFVHLPEGQAQTSLDIGNTPGFPGRTVPLNVSLRRTTNVTAAQFDVAFSPARATPGDPAATGVFSNHVVRSREIAPGIRRVLVYSRVNAAVTVTNSRTALQIPFTVQPAEYVGSGPIVPGNARIARPDATSASPFALVSGSIFVRSVHPQPDGAQLFLPSEAGQRYVIEATTDFVQWSNVSTNTASGEYLEAFDSSATNFTHRFFRSRREP